MPRDKKNEGLGKLVNFNLIDGNRRLMITSDNLPEIKEVKKMLEEYMPKYLFIIEYFGVDMEVRPQADMSYKKFKKVAGYSLWQVFK